MAERPEQGGGFERRLHRTYGLYACGLVLFLVLFALLDRWGWPRSWIGTAFITATVGGYAVIGLVCRTTDEAEYFVAGRRVPAMYNGMATAADWMSAASFIGTAGVLYLQGFAGLAYILGWTGGYCLVALFLAPYLRRFGGFTIPDFLAARYGGVAPRMVGVAATVLVAFVYLVVQIHGVGLVISHLTGFNFQLGIFVGLGGILVCSFLGGMRAVTWTQVAQYIVLILAYAVPVVWLSVKQTGNPVPMLAQGAQLQKIGERERELLHDPRELEVRALYAERAARAEAKLRDVPLAIATDERELAREIAHLWATEAPLAKIQALERRRAALPRDVETARALYTNERDEALRRARPLGGLAPQAVPYPSSETAQEAASDGDEGRSARDSARRNFLALLLCLMIGTAAMPHLLMRCYTVATVREARRSVAWALLFVTLLYLMAPALAVFVKQEVFAHLVGQPFDQLPGWIRRWSLLDRSLVSVEDINDDGVLQFGELRLGAEMIVLAAPEIGGLPGVVTYLVAAGGLAAALSTADGLLLTLSNALSHDTYYRVFNPSMGVVRRVTLAKVAVLVVALAAASVASLRIAEILPFVAAAFSIAAAGLFPALVLGIFWRRCNAAGAVAGMLAGVGLCLFYMATGFASTRELLGLSGPAAQARWFDIDPVAAGVFGLPVGLAVTLLVSLATAPPPAQAQAFVDRLREPQSGAG